MIGAKMEAAINKQINAELYSGYLYPSMAAYFESQNLKGMAHWMEVQAGEEQGHAMRFYNFLNERGGRVKLQAIEQPKTDWKSPLAAFEEAYAHEQKVTAMIESLVDLASSEQDKAAFAMLQWFVSEQVEEEASTSEIAQKLKMVKESGHGVFMIDQALGRRESD